MRGVMKNGCQGIKNEIAVEWRRTEHERQRGCKAQQGIIPKSDASTRGHEVVVLRRAQQGIVPKFDAEKKGAGVSLKIGAEPQRRLRRA